MKNFITYDKYTGEILRVGRVADCDVCQQVIYPHEISIEGKASDLTDYVSLDTLEITRKSIYPVDTSSRRVNVPDDLIFDGLPSNTSVTVSGMATDCFYVDDGELILSFDTEGEYIIDFSHPIYLSVQVVVYAT